MERVKIVTLLLTHRCNLRCSYCYVRDYSGGDMALETAKEIVRQSFAESAGDFDLLEFTFLGGEPFAAFPVLRALSEWIWAGKWPLPYRLTAVTNGTLLTGEVKAWLEENWQRIALALSFDGETAQNVSRSGSLSRVDLDWYHQLWPNLALKMTVAEENVGGLFRDITALWERGIPVNDTFAGGVEPWSEASLDELDRQLDMLTEYLLEKRPPFRSNFLSVDLTVVLSPAPARPFRCGAGESRWTYDTNGRKYPCHLLSPLVLPEDACKTAAGAPFLRSPRCRGCPLDPLCPRCDGNSFRFFGHLGEREACVCSLFKRQIVHACRYQVREILHRERRTERDGLVITAINTLMTQLQSWMPSAGATQERKGADQT